jgi:hypothetical protein
MTLVQCLSALFAVLAAALWFKSATIKTPGQFSIHVAKPDGPFGEPLGGGPLGGTHVGQGYSPALQQLGERLRSQSKWSAAAAISAGISALLQAIPILFRHSS